MNKILLVFFCIVATPTIAWAESWEDRAENKIPWSAEFPDDPACWNPPVSPNSDNPWIVGRGDSPAYDGLRECFRACAENNTCYLEGWQDEVAGSATCKVRGILRGKKRGHSAYVWWKAKTALNKIEFPVLGMSPGKLHVVAWCE